MNHPGFINSIKDNEKDLFEWSETNFLKVRKIIKKYPSGRKQSAVIPLLDLAQRQNKGWLNKKALEKVAETLSMSFIRVLEVATFYSMFNLKPIGKNYIQICRTTPCWLRASDKLLNIAKEVTGCSLGETSKDKRFTVVEVECLGACCNAPMVQINDDYFEDLNEDNFKKLLINLKDDKEISKGSQIGRLSSNPKRKN